MTHAIRLYTWKTPNGRKPAIMLEELGLPYEAVPIDISKDAQFAPDFTRISPNNKIPALVDDEAGVSVFESGAILTYLAEKSGRLLAASGQERWDALAWLHWQIGGLGPMAGQLAFFALRSRTRPEEAIGRFRDEVSRLLRVAEARLAAVPFFGGGSFSIADIAIYPWLAAARDLLAEPLGAAFAEAPHLAAWLERVGARPAVGRGMNVLQD